MEEKHRCKICERPVVWDADMKCFVHENSKPWHEEPRLHFVLPRLSTCMEKETEADE